MRSVVVVLPASIWAMMPMLRVRARSVAMSFALCAQPPASSISRAPGARRRPIASARRRLPASLPPIMGESLIGLGHTVDVVSLLHGCALALRRIPPLVGELLAERAAVAGARAGDQPAHRQGIAAIALDLHRHLIGRAAD